MNPAVPVRQAACAVSLALALAAVVAGCGSGGDSSGSFEPSAPAPPATTSTPTAAPAPPAATVPLDPSTNPRAAAIASRLTAAGYAVQAFEERFRRPSDDMPGSRTSQDFEHRPRALLTVTDPDDDRKVEQLRRRLYAVDSAVSRQGTMETPAQAARIQQLVAGIQNQFRVEVAVYESAADAAADQRDARQPFTTARTVQLVTQATRKGTVVYRLTVAEELGGRYDAAFRKVVDAAEGA